MLTELAAQNRSPPRAGPDHASSPGRPWSRSSSSRVIQFGIVFHQYVTLTDAVRAGARQGTVEPAPAGSRRLRRGSRAGVRGRSRPVGARHAVSSSWEQGEDVALRDVPVQHQPPRHRRDRGTSPARPRSVSNDRAQARARPGRGSHGRLHDRPPRMAAAVLDVGSWYKEDRELQATMDAAALVAHRRCPRTRPRPRRSPSSTRRRTAAGSTRPRSRRRRSQTTRSGHRLPPGSWFFSKVIGIDSITVNATATAWACSRTRAGPLRSRSTSDIPTSGERWGEETTLELDTLRAYRLLNIDGSYGGTNPATLGDWIRDGYEGYMPLGIYYSDPGAKYNTNPNFKSALDDVIATGRSSSSPCTGVPRAGRQASCTRSSAGSGSW